MGSLHDPPALRKRPYISPVFMVRGDIATLTQQSKTFGAGDGYVLVIPNTNIPPIPIQDLS
jgi:hypothetical protein